MQAAYIRKVEGPTRKSKCAAVFATGYLTKNEQDGPFERKWMTALRAAGWEGSIYRVCWRSGRFDSIFGMSEDELKQKDESSFDSSKGKSGGIIRAVATGAIVGVISGPAGMATNAGRKVVGALTRKVIVGAAVAAGITGVAWTHWKFAVAAAERAGEALPSLLRESVPEPHVMLMGHSLGACVMAHGLCAAKEAGVQVRSAVLLGAAVNQTWDRWRVACDAVTRNVFVYFNRNDRVLKMLYRRAQFASAVGREGFIGGHPKVLSFDLSALMGRGFFDSHSGYVDMFSEHCRLPVLKSQRSDFMNYVVERFGGD